MSYPLRTVVALLMLPCAMVEADILIVDPADSGAYQTVDEAVNDAASGDTVRIAPGIYDEPGFITVLNKSMTIESISGDPTDTIIRNEFEKSGSVIQVLGGSGELTLNNLTIQDGMASNGGGLAVASGAYAEVSNCIFRNNFATFAGGGILVDGDSSISVTASTFVGNTTDGEGGGIVARSTKLVGQPTSGFTIDRCVFVGNSAEFGGGAYLGDRDSRLSGVAPEISNCVFSGNVADTYGGGLVMIPVANPELPISAGSIIRNSTFSGNTASLDPAFMLERSNDAANEFLGVRDVIVWGNNGPRTNPIDNLGAYISYSYCCLDFLSELPEGLWSDCIGSDPRFRDADGADDEVGTDDDDLRVEPGSPVIDAGNNDYLGFDVFDVAGDLRYRNDPTMIDTGEGIGAIVDMGAHEFNIADVAESTAIWYGAEDSFWKDMDDPLNWWDGNLPEFSGETLWYGAFDDGTGDNIQLQENESISSLIISNGVWNLSSQDGPWELFVTSGLTSRGSIQIAPYENNFISQLRLMDGVDLDCSFLTIRNWGSLVMSDSVVTLGSKLSLFGGRAVLEGHGTLNREGVPFGAFVSNGGVINLTGELVVDGRYDQYVTEDGVVTNGLVSVSTDDLDEGANLAVQGVGNLAGAMEFSAGIEPPETGTTYTVITATNGFNGSAPDYAVTTGFNDGRFFTLATSANIAGGGEGLVATVQSAADLLLPDESSAATSATVEDMILADVSNPPDGYVDLILSVRDGGSGSVVILLNNGVSGGGDWQDFESYGAAVVVTVCDEPSGLDAGDVDGDGLNDIAVACTDTGEVWLLTNNPTPLSGAPTFSTSSAASAPHLPAVDQPDALPVDVWIGNLDGDMKPDIVVTNLFDGSVVAFKNEIPDLLEGPGGMGGMDGEDNDSYPDKPLSTLDPNAGGKSRDDEVWGASKAGSTTSKGGSSGALTSGTGSLVLTWDNYDTGQGPEDLTVGDLNDDGYDDVITADETGDTFSILLSDGSGGFNSATSFSVGAGGAPISIDNGDVDGDGDLDIVIACTDAGGDRVLRVFDNTLISGGVPGSFGFTQSSDSLSGQGPYIVRLSDVDNDGIDDAVAITTAAPSPLAGGGSSGGFMAFMVSNEGEGKNTCLGDLNDDGQVNGADLGLLIAGWGPCTGTPCVGDLNEDGTVNGADLGLMIAAWGPCPKGQ